MKNIDGFVSLKQYQKILSKEKTTFRSIEKRVFEKNLTPLRYKKNQNSITQKEQFKLFNSHVYIVGCGGLGGNVAELLARVGIGKLTLIDDDTFSEHNLNRQNFCTIKTLNKKKAKVVASNLSLINPALSLHVKVERLKKSNVKTLLKGADVVMDCVDDIKTKKILSLHCKSQNTHFIHGAIAGNSLHVSTSKDIYKFYKDNKKGAEEISGNLSFSASFCASLQASFCIQSILKKDFFVHDILFVDLKDLEFVKIPID